MRKYAIIVRRDGFTLFWCGDSWNANPPADSLYGNQMEARTIMSRLGISDARVVEVSREVETREQLSARIRTERQLAEARGEPYGERKLARTRLEPNNEDRARQVRIQEEDISSRGVPEAQG